MVHGAVAVSGRRAAIDEIASRRRPRAASSMFWVPVMLARRAARDLVLRGPDRDMAAQWNIPSMRLSRHAWQVAGSRISPWQEFARLPAHIPAGHRPDCPAPAPDGRAPAGLREMAADEFGAAGHQQFFMRPSYSSSRKKPDRPGVDAARFRWVHHLQRREAPNRAPKEREGKAGS